MIDVVDEASKDEQDTPAAKAGWYPDPKGSGNLFYWDGSAWTGDVHSPTEPARSKRRSNQIGTPERLVGVGGLGLAIAPFLPWVKVVLIGNLTLFQLYEVAGSSKTLPWLSVCAGAATAAAAFLHRERSMTFVVGICVGLAGGALALYALIGLRSDIEGAHGLAAVGVGPYVAVAGCVSMVVGALMLGSRRSG